MGQRKKLKKSLVGLSDNIEIVSTDCLDIRVDLDNANLKVSAEDRKKILELMLEADELLDKADDCILNALDLFNNKLDPDAAPEDAPTEEPKLS